jgi:UDP-N-acetylmuramoyl-tripeptide--D-alanyl-D-alanine ligase
MRNVVVKILNMLAVKIVGKYKPVIIGVTGSAGKSTTCKVINEVLGTKYEVRFNDSSRRTDISIPLAIIGADSGGHSVWNWMKVFRKALALIFKKSSFYPDILVLDMEVDMPDDMKNMLKVVHPNVAVFTGVGEFPPHVEHFKSDKHIAREMSLLFKSLNKQDIAVLNVDDRFIKDLSKNIKCEKITFGFGAGVMVKGEEIFLGEKKWKTSNGKIGMSFKITNAGTTIPFRFSYAIGRGQIYAALAGTAVGLHLGFNIVEISEALENFKTLPGRMNLIKGLNNSLIIDDSFNSNPSSALAALETVEKLEALRKIAILGDMLELGKYSKDGHRKVGERIPKSVDMVFCYGKTAECFCETARRHGMKQDKIFHFDDKNELTIKLRDVVREGDVILVKGSRAMKMEDVVREMMLEPEMAGELLVR